MTAPDYDQMTPAELATEAARLMGWRLDDLRDAPCWFDSGSAVLRPENFHPARDLNDAARFGGAFLAAWPEHYFTVGIYANGQSFCDVHNVYKLDGPVDSCVNSSEATARTVAVLKAWRALQRGKDE